MTDGQIGGLSSKKSAGITHNKKGITIHNMDNNPFKKFLIFNNYLLPRITINA